MTASRLREKKNSTGPVTEEASHSLTHTTNPLFFSSGNIVSIRFWFRVVTIRPISDEMPRRRIVVDDDTMSRALSLVSLFTRFILYIFFPSFLFLESREQSVELLLLSFLFFPFSIKDRFKAEFEITSLVRSRTRNRQRTTTLKSLTLMVIITKGWEREKTYTHAFGTHTTHTTRTKDRNVQRPLYPDYNCTRTELRWRATTEENNKPSTAPPLVAVFGETSSASNHTMTLAVSRWTIFYYLYK